MTAIVIVSLPAASLALLTKLHAARTKPLAAPALRKRLAQHGYAAHAAVLAFEKAFGGLEVPCEETSKDWKTKNEPRWLFGAGACLRSKAHVAPRGGRSQAKLSLVPVVYSPDDYICYLDAEGHAWGHDTIEAEKAKRVARGGEELVAQLVSFIAAEHMDAGEASKAARGVSAKPLTKPKGSARGVSAKPLEEPKGYAVD